MAIPNVPMEVILQNSLNEDLQRESGHPPFPDVIPRESRRVFRVNEGSGHAAYNCGSGNKWIIAWSDEANNFNPEPKKVFTQILYPTEALEWDEIQRTLDKSGYGSKVFKGPCVSYICWRGTTLKATLELPDDPDDPNNPGSRA